MKTIRSKHNNLLNYFIHDHQDLSPAYVRSCEKFFDSICWPNYYGGTNTNGKIYKLNKPQAPSAKLQAPSAPKGRDILSQWQNATWHDFAWQL